MQLTDDKACRGPGKNKDGLRIDVYCSASSYTRN